jgi:hypothetical protein
MRDLVRLLPGLTGDLLRMRKVARTGRFREAGRRGEVPHRRTSRTHWGPARGPLPWPPSTLRVTGRFDYCALGSDVLRDDSGRRFQPTEPTENHMADQVTVTSIEVTTPTGAKINAPLNATTGGVGPGIYTVTTTLSNGQVSTVEVAADSVAAAIEEAMRELNQSGIPGYVPPPGLTPGIPFPFPDDGSDDDDGGVDDTDGGKVAENDGPPPDDDAPIAVGDEGSDPGDGNSGEDDGDPAYEGQGQSTGGTVPQGLPGGDPAEGDSGGLTGGGSNPGGGGGRYSTGSKGGVGTGPGDPGYEGQGQGGGGALPKGLPGGDPA